MEGLTALFALLASPLLLVVLALARGPVVPPVLLEMPGLLSLYLQLLRAAVRKGKAPKTLTGHPEVKVRLARPLPADPKRYSSYLRLMGFQPTPRDAPLMYPIVESFRLSMLAMAHPSFPFNVLGSVLARNTTVVRRAVATDEALTYSCRIDPSYVMNPKGDIEIKIETTGMADSGDAVWRNSLTVIVLNPKRGRGGKPGGAAGEAPPPPPAWSLLSEWKLPAGTGRAYGALNGDRNPIHLWPLTSKLFGFQRPIAHALYLVGRMEAELANAGHLPAYPAVFETEFKRPTLLPAKLRCVAAPGTAPLQAAVLTGDGSKEVILGRLNVAK